MNVITAILVCLLLAPVDGFAGAGFFRVEERGGRFWLLDPDARPFFSTGVNLFHAGGDPADFDPANPEYSALRIHPDFETWCASARDRLQAWGFNTLGAWAEPRAAACATLPYTVCLHLGTWVGSPWMDPATPQAQAAIARLIERDVRPRRDDRQLIGYFVDNELGWYDASLFRYWAAEPATARLKQRHYALLLQHYRGKLAQFLKDFDVLPRPHHFTDLAQPLQQISVRPGRRPPVIDQFVAALADDYYATVAAAVRAADPNHLLLGDRYASGYSQAVARASARHTDVVSVNYAGTEPGGWVSPAFFESLHRVTGKPLLVSEIYTTAHENRSGNRNRHGHYLVVGTQRERAATAAGMAAQLARMPYVVGYHWFQWSDQPTSGREDGEDFNMGLVDLEDRPYEELTAAFSRVHAQVAALHQQGPLLQGLQVRDGAWSVPALSPTLDGRLEDWPLAQHWASDTAASATHLPFGDFYLGWQPEGVVLGLAYNDYSLGAPATDDVRTRRRLLLTLGAAGGAARSHTVLGFDERAQGRPLALEARGAPGLRGEQRIRNLLTTAELLIPAALFGYPRLQAGQVLRLDSRFLLEGETRELRWPARGAARLRLAPAATPAAAE